MAEKDWKKSGYGIIGWKKNCDNFLVTIESSSWGNTFDRAYLVKIIRNGRNVNATKKFKLREDAEEYAKSYMRSH